MTDTNNDTYIISAHVLCSECKQPIRAWINSPQWIRVEWVSPEGECQGCAKQRNESESRAGEGEPSGRKA